ncbi:MAG TPA: succinate dehydrogenase cytochrome b subunit [Acidimicrobiales bacterium]|nr:succinate dehydrogenase cytochrome b subunit [Acidimicrobiales bacterium]
MTTTVAPPLYRTSIGKKVLMAGSGVILLGFVIFHMLGNLKIYLGRTAINKYADGLRTLGEPIFPRTLLLWLVRVVLIAAFAVHVVTAVQLARQSRAARQTRYVHPDTVQADYAARTMRWGGLTIGLFVIFHLAHFTWGWVHPGYTYVRGQVYGNVAAAFNVWWITAIYLFAMIALGLHIYHGTWSIFQTFGVNNRRWDRIVRRGATAVAAIVVIGNSSIPIAVLAGAVK